MGKTAELQQIVATFVKSKTAGIKVNGCTVAQLENTISQMYTRQGEDSPVRVIEKSGEVYLLNREILGTTNGSVDNRV